jgi:hypothetical protein
MCRKKMQRKFSLWPTFSFMNAAEFRFAGSNFKAVVSFNISAYPTREIHCFYSRRVGVDG